MKILFAIKSLQAAGGGAERVLSEIASGLAARGHEITVLTYDPPGGQSWYSLHPAIEWVTIEIGDSQSPARLYETARRMLALRQRVREIGPKVVVGFMHSMFIPLGLAIAGAGIPLIASEHIVPDHYKARPLQGLLLRLTPWLTERITVVSDQALAAYPVPLRTYMSVVPNPVSVGCSELADVAGPAHGRKTLLAVGRLAAQKDHAALIDAFALIRDCVPDWDLRIAGEGELRGELETRIANHGLGTRVHLPGNIRDISREYASAQLFVMPSLYESQGLATSEALAHGLPAVGFADCPGTNTLIKAGRNGVLVEPGENRPRALAEALLHLMQDGEARRRLVPTGGPTTEYDLEKVLAKWEELLRAVGNVGQPPVSPKEKRVECFVSVGRVT